MSPRVVVTSLAGEVIFGPQELDAKLTSDGLLKRLRDSGAAPGMAAPGTESFLLAGAQRLPEQAPVAASAAPSDGEVVRLTLVVSGGQVMEVGCLTTGEVLLSPKLVTHRTPCSELLAQLRQQGAGGDGTQQPAAEDDQRQWYLLCGRRRLDEDAVVPPLEVAEQREVTLWLLSAPGPRIPAHLEITADRFAGARARREYVGLWHHEPLPDNPHVFVREAGPSGAQRPASSMYWLGVMHWRLGGSRESASPAHPSWGKGRDYRSVPGGEAAKYAEEGYASEGLRFNWNPDLEKWRSGVARRRGLVRAATLLAAAGRVAARAALPANRRQVPRT